MILNLITEPNPLLHKVSDFVESVDDGVRRLMDDMLESMYYYEGVGLAAVQVGVRKKVIVIDVGVEEAQGFAMPLFMANAIITESSKEEKAYKEGCLSFPGFKAEVVRPTEISVAYLDYHGQKREIKVQNGLLAVCIQHEVDHTNGKVFVDYLSPLKRSRAVNKVQKYLKQELE